MDAGSLHAQLRAWADNHRRAAGIAGRRPGVKHPMLCVAVDFIREAWGPIVPVVVERPFEKALASLNRLGWWADEQQRADTIKHLVATRDHALADAATVRVDFEALRATPADVIRRLANELHLNATDAQIEAAVQSVVQSADRSDADPYGLDLLLEKVESNPDDAWSVYILAQTYFDSGDFANARKWYERQIEMGAFSEEETYIAMLRIAESMARLDAPWPDVQDAYLRAWEFRPTRAEPLYAIAVRYRVDGRYRLGYLFAERAAQIPFPEQDMMLIDPAILRWRTTDEQAICASWIGKHAEAFTLCRRLVAGRDIPEDDRQRIARNRDFSVPAMLEAASSYPDALVRNLIAGPRDGEVTVTLVAGPDRADTEQTLNSFLHCCTDLARAGRFLVIDAGLSAQDRTMLHERYPFLEFADLKADGLGTHLVQLRSQVHRRFWLHLGRGWRFFAPENLISRLTAVLDAEPRVFQVGINFGDAVKLTGTCATEEAVRRAPDTGRYMLTDVAASGPAMFDIERLDRAGGFDDIEIDAIAELSRLATAAGLQTASLDEVLCISAV
jgi:tetratricopeptide (TPR) repeat protein